MGRQFGQWILMAAVAILVGAIVIAWPFAKTNDDGTLALVEPSFIKQALAEGEANGASLVIQEAGISGYFRADSSIDLTLAQDAFRTIETQGADYLIGSVAVPGHSEDEDVHVYLHKDGWFLAYYFKDYPTAKFIDFPHMTNPPTVVTTLETVLALVADAAGTAAKPLTYYDFRYPNANQMLFVYEDSSNGSDFDIKLPNNYIYFERSVRVTHRFWLDDIELDAISGLSIAATSLTPDVFHNFYTNSQLVFVLTYREE